MSNDSFTEVSSKSWFGRIGGAIVGGLIGVVLFFAAFPVLAWNEGRAIKREKTLQKGEKDMISVPVDAVDSANEGKLVYVTGDLSAGGPVSDRQFGVTDAAIKLRRNVEMYQWSEEKKSETRKKLGGGDETVTTYTYAKKWSDSPVDSSEFKHQDGHENPGEWPVETNTFVAKDVKVGAFELSDSLIEKIDNYEALPVEKGAAEKVTVDLSEPIKVSGEGFYVGKDPDEPAVGDLRIRFEAAKPGPVSIVAGQVQDTFEPYKVKNLGTIELLQPGTVSAKAMFAAEEQGNAIITWLLRLAGFLMFFFGILLIGSPLAVIGDFIPFVGSMLEGGIALIGFMIALTLTIATVALAWLAFRPLLGIPLLVIALGGAVFAIKMLWSKKAAKPAVA